jgi:ribosomal protein S18 acetylase RimI-like enzyme
MAISVTILSRRHCLDIVRLHRSGIKTGFLSTTGDVFLRTLYIAISRSPFSRIYCAIDDDSGKTIGFIAGTLSTSAMYRYIILRYCVVFFILLLPDIFKPSNLMKILETLFYSHNKKAPRDEEKGNAPCQAELLSIVVDETFRGQKIGKKLVDSLERYFAENGVHEYKVVTYSMDANANIFYQACGFVKQTEFIHHGNVMFEYSKTIEAIAQP